MTTRLHFERHDRAGSFVDLELRGSTIRHTWGRLETEGTARVEDHADAAKASRAFETQARRLDHKGYLLGHHHPELMAAIAARPADPAGYLVYGDWLLEHQDPRGDLIARMAASEPFEELLVSHARELAPAWWVGCEPEWRFGFVQRMTCRAATRDLLRRLLRHPSVMLLEELVIELPGHFPDSHEPWGRALSKRPKSVRSIRFIDRPELAEALMQEVPEIVL